MPKAERSFIEPMKLRGYLLSQTHTDGRHKAKMFKNIGVEATMFQELEDELLRVGRENDVIEIEETPRGPKYVVHGVLTAPDGRQSLVKTVWIIDKGSDRPRLVTAWPLEDT